MSRKFIFTSYNSGFVYDLDALQFIANWELSTSATMPLTQRMAVNDLYRGLKGEGTTFGTNFLTSAKSRGAVLYPLVPLDDSTANANAYRLDAISNGVIQGTYNGFVAGDFTQNGVIGGVGKFFNSTVAPSNFLAGDVSASIYSRSNIAQAGYVLGSRNGSVSQTLLNPRRITNPQLLYNVNDNSTGGSTMGGGSDGFYNIQRLSNVLGVFKNAVNVVGTGGALNVTLSTNNYYAHASNNNGVTELESTRQLCFYSFGLIGFSANQLADFYTVIQRLQSNIITGGRQIGASIPPIS
jgi:hypothetical protein